MIITKGHWRVPKQAFVGYFFTIQESDGTFSTIVLNLPGAGSCGDTPADSVVNAIEALKAAAQSYLDEGKNIPWIYPVPEPTGFGVKNQIYVERP